MRRLDLRNSASKFPKCQNVLQCHRANNRWRTVCRCRVGFRDGQLVPQKFRKESMVTVEGFDVHCRHQFGRQAYCTALCWFCSWKDQCTPSGTLLLYDVLPNSAGRTHSHPIRTYIGLVGPSIGCDLLQMMLSMKLVGWPMSALMVPILF
jgi:hypothetical protein